MRNLILATYRASILLSNTTLLLIFYPLFIKKNSGGDSGDNEDTPLMCFKTLTKPVVKIDISKEIKKLETNQKAINKAKIDLEYLLNK